MTDDERDRLAPTPDPVQQCGSAVLIQGDGLEDIAKCILARIRESQRNGYSIEPYARLLTSVHAARMSAARHEFATYVLSEQESEGQDVVDWFSVEEAAAVLALSRRQTQRVAQQLFRAGLAKRIGTTWALKRAPVLALKLERDRKARNGERQR
jgi:hypothetical protein